MKYLEVVNKPQALKGKKIIHRNIDFLVFVFDSGTKKCAIYEDYKQWDDNTPAYWFTDVVKITCFNEEEV